MSMGLYDSDTGKSIETERVVDISTESAGSCLLLRYGTTKKGQIVQVVRLHEGEDATKIHYIVGSEMLKEDASRLARMFDVDAARLQALIAEHAPVCAEFGG